MLCPCALPSRACVAEKRPLTNRIRRHFARIKAVGPIAAIMVYCAKSGAWRHREPQGVPKAASGYYFQEENSETSRNAQTFRRRKSGHVGTVSRGDHAAIIPLPSSA